MDDTGSEEARVVLEAAGYLLPLFTDVPWVLSRIMIARRDFEAAIPPLEYTMRWTRNPELREDVARVLANVKRLQAESQAKAVDDAPQAPAPEE